MLNPLKRSGGRRYYRSGDVAIVKAIDSLVNEEGYTIKGARSALESADRRKTDRRFGKDAEPEMAFPNRSREEALALSEAIPQLKALRARLEAVLEG